MTVIVIGMLRNLARITLALILALLFAVALTVLPARAAVFEVDSTAGTNTGTCTATNDCTLRGAINVANSTTDTINFDIPESGEDYRPNGGEWRPAGHHRPRDYQWIHPGRWYSGRRHA